VTPLDPRLAPVIAAKRRSGWVAGLFGTGLLLVAAMSIAGKAISDNDRGTVVLLVLCVVVFIVPGVFLLRIWLRGPERTAVVRALTEGRADLTGFRVDYVSTDGGATESRVWVFSRTTGAEEVTLAHGEAAGLIAYLGEVAPQARARSR
jgi:hypothetical protein